MIVVVGFPQKKESKMASERYTNWKTLKRIYIFSFCAFVVFMWAISGVLHTSPQEKLGAFIGWMVATTWVWGGPCIATNFMMDRTHGNDPGYDEWRKYNDPYLDNHVLTPREYRHMPYLDYVVDEFDDDAPTIPL